MAVYCLAKKVLQIRPSDKKHPGGKDRPSIIIDPVTEVARRVQACWAELYHVVGRSDFRVPGNIVYQINLKRHETADCPCLYSDFSVTSMHGDVCSGDIEIHAENVEDILGVLRSLPVTSFTLKFVENTNNEDVTVERGTQLKMEAVKEGGYVDAVKDFLSTNPSLEKLSVLDHYLRNDQELVRGVMRSSKSLSTLEFSHRTLSDEGILERSLNDYIAAIPECNCLQRLILSNVKNPSQGTIDTIASVLVRDSPLLALDMSNGSWGREPLDVLAIAQALNQNSTLEELDLGQRILANDGCISALAKTVELNSCLKRLDLQATGRGNDLISQDAWIPMGDALARSSALEYLDISKNHISEASWKSLAEGLKSNTSLLTLKARRPYFETSQRKTETDMLLPMFETLCENDTIRSLQLTGYNLSDSRKALETLASALAVNTSLKSLQLDDSSITDEGVIFLSRVLPKMKLEHLDLNHHEFSQKGAEAFARGMAKNYSLLTVGVGQTYRDSIMIGYAPPLSADGFEKEFHEIQYYARLNRKARRCWTQAPLNPSLWSLVLSRAMQNEKRLGPLLSKDVRKEDRFAGNHDTSIDAVYFLLRNVMTLPVDSSTE